MSPPSYSFNPIAAILAWLWPGLGHIVRGQRRRGLLIMGGLLFMFFSGLLVGGLDCVDRKNDPLWFLAQSVCGPIVIVTDRANQSIVQKLPAGWREEGDERRVIDDLVWSGRPMANQQKDPELLRRYADQDEELLRSLRRIGLGRINEMGTLFIALAGLMNLVVILDALYTRTGPDS